MSTKSPKMLFIRKRSKDCSDKFLFLFFLFAFAFFPFPVFTVLFSF
jgi:hypothetical protein